MGTKAGSCLHPTGRIQCRSVRWSLRAVHLSIPRFSALSIADIQMLHGLAVLRPPTRGIWRYTRVPGSGASFSRLLSWDPTACRPWNVHQQAWRFCPKEFLWCTFHGRYCGGVPLQQALKGLCKMRCSRQDATTALRNPFRTVYIHIYIYKQTTLDWRLDTEAWLRFFHFFSQNVSPGE